ncbi:MAG: hypothetical protein GYB37_15310, partial [Algicola sp.]|nr:hypothetical protein [Algicola sp.]
MKTMIFLILLVWAVNPNANAQTKLSNGKDVLLVVDNSNKKLTDIIPFDKNNAKNLARKYPKSTFYSGKLYKNGARSTRNTKSLPLKGTRSFNIDLQNALIT